MLKFLSRSHDGLRSDIPTSTADQEYRWIFCGGMLRSGSTLHYNIAAEIVEHARIGRREAWVDDHAGYFAGPDSPTITVFKSHILSPQIEERIATGQVLALITFRDIRDATASWQAKTRSFMDVDAGLAFAKLAIDLLEPWENLAEDRRLLSRYETFVENVEDEVVRVARALGVALSLDAVQTICTNVSVPSMERHIRRSEAGGFAQAQGNTFDPRTLVHTDHLNGGAIGRYKDELSADLAGQLTLNYADWLTAHGYAL